MKIIILYSEFRFMAAEFSYNFMLNALKKVYIIC